MDLARSEVEGAASLVRLLIYELRSSASALTQVRALVRLADFQLRYARGEDASDATLELYEIAYRQLAESQVQQSFVEELFSPKIPVVVPAYRSNPLVSGNVPESAGHIDVSFSITKYGISENVEILDATEDVSRARKRDLVRLIEASRFRPRVMDGQFADPSRVVVRYYSN